MFESIATTPTLTGVRVSWREKYPVASTLTATKAMRPKANARRLRAAMSTSCAENSPY